MEIAESDWARYDSCESLDADSELETALLTKPHYDYHVPPAGVQRNWPRGVSALLLRMQLQLRHRLGVSVSLPAGRWVPSRLAISPSPSTNNWVPTHHRFRPKLFLRTAVYAILLAPPLLLVLIVLYGGVPPSYADVKRRERALPQHHWHSTNTRIPSGERGVRSMLPVEGEAQEMYLRFPDHVWGHGLNNVLQEAILTTHLTLTTSPRTPVFESYTWSHLPLPYTLYDFALRPTRVPLSAFVGGVLAGAIGVGDPNLSVDDSSNLTTRRTRRAVSAEYFENVCAPSEIVEVVYGLDGPPELASGVAEQDEDGYYPTPSSPDNALSTQTDAQKGNFSNSLTVNNRPHSAPAPRADGRAILAWFAHRLRAPDVRGKRCVVVREDPVQIPGARRVFDADFFGSRERIGPILPELLASPVLKRFAWSPLVNNAVVRSVRAAFGPLLQSDSNQNPNPNTETSASSADNFAPNAIQLDEDKVDDRDTRASPMLEGVLALHLRRGDYGRHCVRLAQWGASYLGVNGILGDEFAYRGEDSGRGGEAEENTDDEERVQEAKRKEEYYLEHCLPSIEQVVRRLGEVRAEYEAGRDSSLPNATSTSVPASSDRDPNLHPHPHPHNHNTTTSPARHLYRLKHVYVLTNGWPAFVDDLRSALLADGWHGVVATADLERGMLSPDPPLSSASSSHSSSGLSAWFPPSNWLSSLVQRIYRIMNGEDSSVDKSGFTGLTREERGVDVGVDMGIAERAEVFVGNGFSSLSANIVMLRMARGLGSGANRLL